jgi:hypothetical protein
MISALQWVNAMGAPYTFQPVTQIDLPQLEVWLQAPETIIWWGDPVEQAELLRSDIDEPRMQMELVLFDGQPSLTCRVMRSMHGHNHILIICQSDHAQSTRLLVNLR